MKNVAIIILTFNGEKDTMECLESIAKMRSLNYKLQTVVVDNGSTDVDTSVISNFQFPISNFGFKIIQNKENLGFAGGNNVGIRHALENGADYVVILNNDTIVHTDLINELVKTAESSEKIGIVVPKIYFAPGFEFHKDRYKKEELGKVIWYAGGIIDWDNVIGYHRGVDEVDHGQYNRIEEADFATGCCMLIKKEVLQEIGLFDEKYFLYYEDNDLSKRVKKAGYKIVYAPKAILWHKNAGSAGGAGSSVQDYYITRNRLLFGIRYAPIRSKLALIRESVGLLLNGRPWQRRGVLDFYLRRFGRGSFII